jgi:Rho family protein
VLVALKCDLREAEERAANDDPEGINAPSRFIDYNQGLDVAERIKALRYLGKLRVQASTEPWGSLES